MNSPIDNVLLGQGIRKNASFSNRPDIDNMLIYEFLSRFLAPFKDWPAYRSGVINDKGKILITRNKMTSSQSASFTKFDLVILKIKLNTENSMQGVISKNIPIQTKLALLLRESEVPANATGPAIAPRDILLPMPMLRRKKLIKPNDTKEKK